MIRPTPTVPWQTRERPAFPWPRIPKWFLLTAGIAFVVIAPLAAGVSFSSVLLNIGGFALVAWVIHRLWPRRWRKRSTDPWPPYARSHAREPRTQPNRKPRNGLHAARGFPRPEVAGISGRCSRRTPRLQRFEARQGADSQALIQGLGMRLGLSKEAIQSLTEELTGRPWAELSSDDALRVVSVLTRLIGDMNSAQSATNGVMR